MKTFVYVKNDLIRILPVLFISLSNISYAQLREGFDPEEAKILSAICNSFTFLELYGSDSLIVPKEYRKTFTSEIIGLDNMFQVYESNKVGVINFRGSTANTSSWVENFFSAMIPGEGVININKIDRPYKFASDTNAAVHSGYSLAVVLFSPLLIEQINILNEKGIYHIFITGHSQGGSLAILSRAYLENLTKDIISSKNVFKTYAFAAPMCGNKQFAEEYQVMYGEINMSYTIINPADLVPKMPMHYQEEGKFFGTLLFKSWVYGLEPNDSRSIKESALKIFEPVLTGYINSSNRLIERIVSRSYISIVMPEYVKDINYFQTGAVRKLEPFSFPKVKVDTLKMTQKEITKLKIDEEGNYYIKETSFFQHKPYQYYVAILKEYFSREYRELNLLCLPMDVETSSFIALDH